MTTRRSVPRKLLADLGGGASGLDAREVERRRNAFGPNDIVEVPGNPWVTLAGETVRDPMIWFLVGTGVLYLVLGSVAEAVTLLVSIVPLVAMDAYLHRRTRASTEGLAGRLGADATVVRGGVPATVPARDVVPGDLVVVGPGEAFAADGIVVEAVEAQIDESALSGESLPVRKVPLREAPPGKAEVGVELVHWAFAGTRVLAGRISFRVVYTGRETLYGEIVRAAASGGHDRTDLQRAVARLVAVLLAAATILCAALAAVRLRQGHGWLDAIVSAATLAMAALPEEFPVVLTVFLGVGVYRLARRQALVRRAVSVENIGRVTCICSDKTGTITLGRLELAHLLPAFGVSEDALLGSAAAASRPETGDPLDETIVRTAAAKGLSTRDGTVLATFPFTEERRRETCVTRTTAGRLVATTKGSPETILALVALSDAERAAWRDRVDELASAGHKVVACARRDLDETWRGDEPAAGFVWLGLCACEDPVRPGVTEAIARCRQAGIRVIMVTGDHPLTAATIAKEIGLGGGAPRVIVGEAIDAYLASGEAALAGVDVVARAMPAQKLALVEALRATGEIVAVTGDGVNDVPALQAADVGIAMAGRGTRSAREVASIVLLDDDFGTIADAVAEGRQLFGNLALAFEYLFMMHIPLVLTATLIPFAGYPLLYLPIHVVWLEAIIHPTALLVFQDLARERPVARPGRDARTILTWRQWVTVGTTGGLLTIAILGAFHRSLGAGHDVEHARAMALVALSCASAAITIALSGLRTRAARIVATSTVALAVVLVQPPFMARLLQLRPLHLDDWLIAAAIGAAAAVVPISLTLRSAGPRRLGR